MKTIGLIGGMSWESTSLYYKTINEYIKNKLGGLYSAKCILYSVNFEEISRLQKSGDWEKCGEILGDIAKKLETAGADYIVICTNTMHKVVPEMKKYINIPVIHIAEAAYGRIAPKGIKNIGLLGTKYTMQQYFYKSILIDKGLNVIIPDEEDIEFINNVIFNELCCGEINPKSKQKFIEIVEKLKKKGAEGVILGCTEIVMLISQKDIDIPVFDTTAIHAETAAQMSIE
ncbi:MAG: aspartate/glutamate racemase family protein [Mucispirillum sp.]|nr:aspartate/glutamate racemase family protein [Mucispirillum sp.]